MSMVVVGSVALDTVKTPFGEAADALGGSCSYSTVAARRFAEPVSMVAVVGEDFPADHVAFFDERGVDTSGLVRTPGRTFRWGGEYGFDLNTRETLFTELNVFAEFKPELSSGAQDCDYLFLANIDPTLQRAVLDQTRKPRMVVMDTMNFWIDGARDSLLETIARVDVLLLNDEETRMLTGEANLIRAARKVLELGPRVVIVKKGEHGALVFSREFTFSAPAYPVELIYDPTGAGDSFAGGFLGYLAQSEDCWDPGAIRRAVIYGTVMASFTVEAFSLDGLAQATRPQVEERFARIREMANF